MKKFTTFLLYPFLFLMVLLPLSFLHAQNKPCLGDFLDGVFESQINEHQLAGVTFSMVSADTLEITKSWGYANVETLRKVDENTGFMIGSVSKLFVWIAVMQLLEEGKIDLNTPIDQYLTDLQLPDNYESITMKHLMTHTPGFEDKYGNLFSTSHQNIPALNVYLEERIPQQIFEPGTVPAYSNYGTGLAAFVVQQITGMDFNDYVDENIFEPLQMDQTTFRQPASFAINEQKSKGYIFEEGKFVSPFDEYVNVYPAGAAVSSATDMLKLLKFFLQVSPENDLSDTEMTDTLPVVLEENTIQKMFTTLNKPNPHVSGMGHGLLKMDYRGMEILWHPGNTYFFQTAFVLVPEKQTGLFFSVNTGETDFQYADQFLLILDHFFGFEDQPEPPLRVNGMNNFSGLYKPSRRNENDYYKIATLFSLLKVSNTAEGLIVDFFGKEYLFKPQGDDVFLSKEKKIVFERDEGGKIRNMMFADLPVVVFSKISFRESPYFNLTLIIIVILFSFKNVFVPIVNLFKGGQKSSQFFRWMLFFSSVFLILFFSLAFTKIFTVENILFEPPSSITIIMIMPLLALLFFIATVIFWLQRGVWRKQPFGKTLWHFLVFLIMVVFYTQMHFWNFFNFASV
ncbi:MAG: serine hydrolase domain-containing protein [Bacteroidales bacterium]